MTRNEKLVRLAALATTHMPAHPLVAPFVFWREPLLHTHAGIIGANKVQRTWTLIQLPGTTVLVDGRGRLAPEGAKAGDMLSSTPPLKYAPNGFPARRFPCFRLDLDEQIDALIEYEEALVRDRTAEVLTIAEDIYR